MIRPAIGAVEADGFTTPTYSFSSTGTSNKHSNHTAPQSHGSSNKRRHDAEYAAARIRDPSGPRSGRSSRGKQLEEARLKSPQRPGAGSGRASHATLPAKQGGEIHWKSNSVHCPGPLVSLVADHRACVPSLASQQSTAASAGGAVVVDTSHALARDKGNGVLCNVVKSNLEDSAWKQTETPYDLRWGSLMTPVRLGGGRETDRFCSAVTPGGKGWASVDTDGQGLQVGMAWAFAVAMGVSLSIHPSIHTAVSIPFHFHACLPWLHGVPQRPSTQTIHWLQGLQPAARLGDGAQSASRAPPRASNSETQPTTIAAYTPDDTLRHKLHLFLHTRPASRPHHLMASHLALPQRLPQHCNAPPHSGVSSDARRGPATGL
ncbi:hypothetical protein G7046_g3488 [Stylonectria norvegica]|nr:hypothetical protein G7046_g3488 [Stylonectria norvegica]